MRTMRPIRWTEVAVLSSLLVLVAADEKKTASDLMPVDSHWAGKRTANGETIALRGPVVTSEKDKIELRLKGQSGSVELWAFAVKGTQLTLADVTVVKGARHLEDVEGAGEVQGTELRAVYSWRRDGAKVKGQAVKGELRLNLTNEK